MKLGIDFGTTRVIVAAVDRGNYPLAPFETAEGTYDWFPSLAAVRRNSNGAERRFGGMRGRSRPTPAGQSCDR